MSRLCVPLLLLALAAATGAAHELKTTTGKTVAGTLSAISAAEVVLKTDAGPVATPLRQVLAVEIGPVHELAAGTSYARVQLIDESVLHCKEVKFEAKDVELTLLSGTVVKVPTAVIGSVLREAQDSNLARQWEKFAKDNSRRDRIFILRGGDLNALEGTLGDIDPAAQTVAFKRDGAGSVALPLSRLQGLIFHRTDVPAESPVCRVIDRDGSSVVAASVEFGGDVLTARTTAGVSVAFKQDAVAKLDFNFGKLTYLSDLDAKETPSPWLAGFESLKKDTNLDGSPIVLQDRTYDKGLAMYAGTELEYQLGGKYKDFKAVLGADPRIAEEGQDEVVLTIYCDGEKRFSQAVSVREPRPISVNVKDVNVLRIVTTGRDFTNLAGHATLADARVSQ